MGGGEEEGARKPRPEDFLAPQTVRGHRERRHVEVRVFQVQRGHGPPGDRTRVLDLRDMLAPCWGARNLDRDELPAVPRHHIRHQRAARAGGYTAAHRIFAPSFWFFFFCLVLLCFFFFGRGPSELYTLR